jgi:hypothetical protein
MRRALPLEAKSGRNRSDGRPWLDSRNSLEFCGVTPVITFQIGDTLILASDSRRFANGKVRSGFLG